MLTTLLYLGSWAIAEECKPAESHEELEVYVLTSGPGNSPYTRIGHTALWVSGGGKRETVFNWGAYDSSQDNFLWHFFMGDAEYKLAMMSRPYNIRRVQQNEQKLVAQHLNLTADMKLAMAAELARLAHPDNQKYVYHWESQNCSTLIRDLVDNVTEGALTLSSSNAQESTKTRRFEVLRHLEGSGWPWFGWHYMASDYGDRQYNNWDGMHIPKRLYETLKITDIAPNTPLVDHECDLNPGAWAPDNPTRHTLKFALFGSIVAGVSVYWYKTRDRLSTTILSSWFMVSGLISTFFMGCWMFSTLDGYGFNENWFYSNPIHLVLVYFLWKRQVPKVLLWILTGIATLGITWKIFDTTPQDNIDWIVLFGIPTLMLQLLHTKTELSNRTK